MQEQKANELRILSVVLLLLGLVLSLVWKQHPSPIAAASVFVFIIASILVSLPYAESLLNIVGRIGVAVGALLNAVVIVANGGRMPFVAPGLEGVSVWAPATASTKLLFLADIHPFHGLAYYSIGDAFIVLSAVLVTLGLLSEYQMSRRISSLESTEENQ